MSQEKIQSINLNKFRGATKPLEISFDPKKSMIMIFGENGTGKSTIIDSMDFIFNKKCGSLKEKSSTNIKNHLPSVGSSPKEVEVSIRSQKHEWKGKLNGSKPEIKGNINNFAVGILRRDTILKLVNAEPSERYEFLKGFIELSYIRFSEESLKKCINDIGNNLDRKIIFKENQENNLKQSWEKEGRPESDYLKWIEEESKKEASKLKEKTNQYNQCIINIKKCFEAWNQFKELKAKVSEQKKQLSEAQDKLKEIEEKGQGQSKETMSILKETHSFLEKKNTDECPACEQPIDPKNLKERIAIRLEEMQDLVVSTENYTKVKKEYDFLEKDFLKSKKEFTTSIKSLIKFLENEKTTDEMKKDFNISEYQFLIEGEIDLKKTDILFGKAKIILKTFEDIYNKDNRSLHQLNLIKTSLKSLKETKQKIEELNNKKEFLNRILQIIKNERKSYVENILNSISNDIENLYSKLHPEEGLCNIKLFLNPTYQASLEIKSNFQNKSDIPPQAYFSDSHLDTLGICVFIAMAKYFKNNIIVLDDVLTSIDQPHIERFIQILHDENKYFNQIILTTHYRPWREKYKFYRHPSSNIQLIELYPFWTIEKGIRSSQTKLSIEELEILKEQNPFDRQIAGSKAGILLESIFDHLTLLYGLFLPRKPEPIYTLGELMSCFPKLLINNMQIQNINGDKILLSNFINEIFQITEPIRNKVGCHWNNIGQHFSDHQIKSFLEKTIVLGKILVCDQCGGLPNRKKLDCWKCSCEKTSFYPLRK